MAFVLKTAACSDKGCRRHNNEDNFCLNGLFMQREEMDFGGLFTADVRGRALFAVCDGMGGEEAGEEASLLSATLCAELLENGKFSTKPEDIKKFLHQGCVTVLRQAEDNENNSGSTVSILLVSEEGLMPVNMGDSRAYRLSREGFVQISQDHTEMQRLLRLGEITPEQVKTHPRRHMILQYWGMPLSIAPFTPYIGRPIPHRAGDRYLLCSDGLTDMLEDHEIEAIMRTNLPAEKIAQMLVDEAKRHGGRDNVTVIVIDVVEDGQPQKAKNAEKPVKESAPRKSKRQLIVDDADTQEPPAMRHAAKKTGQAVDETISPEPAAQKKQDGAQADTAVDALRKKRNALLGVLGVLSIADLYLIAEWIERLMC